MSQILPDNCDTSLPVYPEVDISLLGPTGGINPNSPGYPEIDITLLPGVPAQQQVLAYKHTQNASSTTWTIVHNLNFYPNVTVFDSSGSIWQEGTQTEGNVVHIDNKHLTIHFSVPLAGTAILS
jgi:hypothetical protein